MYFCFSQEIIGDFCQQFYEIVVVGISLQWVVRWVISNQEAGTVILEFSEEEWCCENNKSWMEKSGGGIILRKTWHAFNLFRRTQKRVREVEKRARWGEGEAMKS